jgi:hypothetical protein
MKHLKIAIPAFMLLIIFFISGRYFVFLSFIEFQKSSIKSETILNSHSPSIKKFVSANDLYKNKNGLEWKHNNSEVLIDGAYYEVVEINKLKTGYAILLKADEKESELHRSFFKIKNQDESGRSASVIQLLLNVLFIPNPSDLSFCVISKKFTYPTQIINLKLSDHLHRLIKPPCYS